VPAPEAETPVEAVVASAGGDQPSGDAAAEPVGDAGRAAAASEEEQPKPVLLWRQARFERPRGNHHRHDNRPRGGQGRNVQASGEGAVGGRPNEGGSRGEAGKGDEGGKGRPRFDRSRFKGKPGDRPQGEGTNRHGKPNRPGGRPEGKGGALAKPTFQGKPREERPARFDPDSPFAKLAALRDQLKK
jgi:ATP-dependent RNA helicase SUPV3L1/SUV3